MLPGRADRAGSRQRAGSQPLFLHGFPREQRLRAAASQPLSLAESSKTGKALHIIAAIEMVRGEIGAVAEIRRDLDLHDTRGLAVANAGIRAVLPLPTLGNWPGLRKRPGASSFCRRHRARRGGSARVDKSAVDTGLVGD
jgi:hypothetical protein